jgi:DNA-binding FrmR family transcriptional regulator
MKKKEIEKDLVNRLQTLKGHITGIEGMITENKDCKEILVQILAIKSSINKIGMVITEDYIRYCFSAKKKKVSNLENDDFEADLRDVIDTALKLNK